MNRTIHGRPYIETRHGPVMAPCAPHGVLSRLGDRWTIVVMSLLSLAPENRLRFSELKNGIDGISQRMLTQVLRNLERDGLVTRRIYPEVPPRVEYELTDVGRSILPALEGFTGWIRENWQLIAESRERFDTKKANPTKSRSSLPEVD